VSRDEREVAIAGLIGLVTLLGGAYLLAPLRDQEPEPPRHVRTEQELRPSPDYWLADARRTDQDTPDR